MTEQYFFVAYLIVNIFFLLLLIYLCVKLEVFTPSGTNNASGLSNPGNMLVCVDVKDFVSETLSQVIEGVAIVQKKFPSTNGATDVLINPAWIPSGGADASITNHARRICDIEFELMVVASENTSSQVGGSLSIKVCSSVAQLNLERSLNYSLNSTNKIKFNVPVRLPLMKPAKEDWDL